MFDIVKLAADPANADAINFLNYCNTRGPGNIDASRALNEIVKLYNDHGKHAPTGTTPTGDPAKIDTDGHKNTYLFFTKLLPDQGGLGQATLDFHSLTWGNAFIIFGDALKDDHTIVHEAGHSFSLFHSFEDGYAPHVFYHGYTENYMDYTWNVSHFDASGNAVLDDNKYKRNMYSFFK